MRILTSSLVGLSFLAAPLAFAHDVKKKTPKDLSELKLPTDAEIEQIIDEMPDLDVLMGAMMNIVQDEDLHETMKSAGENFADHMKDSGLTDMELEDGELPDFNKLMSTMLRTFSNEDVMGGMLDVVEELQEAVEDNIDEDMLKPKKD